MKSHQITLTFDVENDCSLDSFKGIELGLPKILKLLERNKIPATFFVTGQVAELFPKTIQKLAEKYEVGCHGYYHESFQEIDKSKENLLNSAKKIIEETTGNEILGFRAPYLRASQDLFNVLSKLGFKYDSSLALFKISHRKLTPKIREFRLMIPNVFFRFPLGDQLFKTLSLINKLAVFYFHPWEAIDIRSLFLKRSHYFWNLISRPDRWFNTNSKFLTILSNFIRFNLNRRTQFRTLAELYSESP